MGWVFWLGWGAFVLLLIRTAPLWGVVGLVLFLSFTNGRGHWMDSKRGRWVFWAHGLRGGYSYGGGVFGCMGK